MQTEDKFSLDLKPLWIRQYYFLIWTIILTAVYKTNIMMNVNVNVIVIVAVVVAVVAKWNMELSQQWQEWQKFPNTLYTLKLTGIPSFFSNLQIM